MTLSQKERRGREIRKEEKGIHILLLLSCKIVTAVTFIFLFPSGVDEHKYNASDKRYNLTSDALSILSIFLNIETLRETFTVYTESGSSIGGLILCGCTVFVAEKDGFTKENISARFFSSMLCAFFEDNIKCCVKYKDGVSVPFEGMQTEKFTEYFGVCANIDTCPFATDTVHTSVDFIARSILCRISIIKRENCDIYTAFSTLLVSLWGDTA